MKLRTLIINNQKIAWVTGGRGGIGSAVVRAFENMGYKTWTVSRNNPNKKLRHVTIDISNKEHVSKLSNIMHTDNPPDILVTCHAAPPKANFVDQIFTDLIGIHNVCTNFISKMKKNKWGRIINLTSYHSTGTYPERMGYAAAKAGVAGYSRALALTLAKYNITVNCVAPGVCETPRTRKFIEEGLVNEARLLKRTPLRRFVSPGEVAGLVAFLASNKASFITGQEIVIDGGYGISNYAGDY